jgi:hypothetical protein
MMPESGLASHPEAAFERDIEVEPLRRGRMQIAPKGVDHEPTIELLVQRYAAHIAGQLNMAELAA